MKISVIMIDGGFRENIFSAKYFSQQDFPDDEYEVIWVEYYDKPNTELEQYSRVKVISLNSTGTYHPSCCFNAGLSRARGEVVIIPDADQIVPPDFISRVWRMHQEYENLVVYGFRFDELAAGSLKSHSFDELQRGCVLKDPSNYGGCLTVRRKRLLELNGYEQHPAFRSGFHACGRDLYVRFKNYGLAIRWDSSLRLYHPWHENSLTFNHPSYSPQMTIVQWKEIRLVYGAFNGLDSSNNLLMPDELQNALQNL